MKIKFREIKMGKANKVRLQQINEIIQEYQADNYVLTLRQLYYQLVSRDIIPNKQSEYAKLSGILKEGRMAGIVDWNAIEDRLRRPSVPSSWNTPKDIINSALNSYELPRQDGQETYIEVWVEKDALSGVLRRVTERYHVPILVNRGYSSVSSMYDSYKRFTRAMGKGQDVVILYLGDFDPSGLDMVNDIENRILEFYNGNDQDYLSQNTFKIKPIALTKAQIKQYSPPPNPAKITDPRAKEFIKLHGATSWEVDALPPKVLNKLLEDNITDIIDVDKYLDICEREEADKKKIKSLFKYLA